MKKLFSDGQFWFISEFFNDRCLFVQGKLKGDEVIVPAVSLEYNLLPLQQYGLKVKFVDIDLDTLNINLEMLKKLLLKKIKAIFIVNLLGNPIEKDRLYEIIGTSNIEILKIIVSSRATYNGEKLELLDK